MSTILRPVDQRSTRVVADPSDSFCLPAWAYTDENLFARERQEIFYKSWIYAGSVHGLVKPGDYLTAQLFNESVIIMRGRDGELHGFYNVCQHRAHQLLSGRGHVSAIVCPYHSWSYDTEGGLRAAPGCEHLKNFAKSEVRLKSIRVEVFARHFVFFNLDPDAATLRSQAGDLEERLQTNIPGFAELQPVSAANDAAFMGNIAANWKVVIDNFLECNHCATAHPAFCDLLDMGEYRTSAHGMWSSQEGTLKSTDNDAYALPETVANKNARFYWLWPGITFNLLPGDPAVLLVLQWLPNGIGGTSTSSQYFGPAGTECDAPRMQYLNSVLGPEDTALCESVQRGLSSRGYTDGRIVYEANGAQQTEIGVHAFHRRVVKTLGL
jgi:choline monooxygenase